ncbi:hypothetical protein [Lactococcus allomyrinae]|uniref:Uncharacterized protein n=1 Tax=Lactococcus allomyrinae TaxID=2419773 RepID=A0A387BE07_9LACT|nr:hypothetical protein [Lactococcus allomyrinae]AYF99838.1 hypothetical protein D7I46_01315 [Lactococcus allomyrinae]
MAKDYSKKDALIDFLWEKDAEDKLKYEYDVETLAQAIKWFKQNARNVRGEELSEATIKTLIKVQLFIGVEKMRKQDVLSSPLKLHHNPAYCQIVKELLLQELENYEACDRLDMLLPLKK